MPRFTYDPKEIERPYVREQEARDRQELLYGEVVVVHRSGLVTVRVWGAYEKKAPYGKTPGGYAFTYRGEEVKLEDIDDIPF